MISKKTSLSQVIERQQNKFYNKDKNANARITPCDFFNDQMRNWGHKYIYNYDSLVSILQ